MGPRPACSVCGSKRWRKDRSGIVICEEGHVLENFRTEENDQGEPSRHTVQKRTIRKEKGADATKKRSGPDPNHFVGEEKRFLRLELLQLLLRHQIKALVEHWEVPSFVEVVARDIWLMILACHQLPPVPDRLKDGDLRDPRPGPSRAPNRVRLRPAGPEIGKRQNDSGEGSSEHEKSDASIHGTSDHEKTDVSVDSELLAEVSNESGAATSSSERSAAKATVPPAKKRGRPPNEPRRRPQTHPQLNAITPETVLSVTVLSLLTARVPFMLVDIVNAINDHTLPLLEFGQSNLIPPEMRKHMGPRLSTNATWPRRAPSLMYIYRSTITIADKLDLEYGFKLPEINAPATLWRLTASLGGTPRHYRLAHQILRDCDMSLTYSKPRTFKSKQLPDSDSSDEETSAFSDSRSHSDREIARESSPARIIRLKSALQMPRRTKGTTCPPELRLCAAVIMVFKMAYGLDGRTRTVKKSKDPSVGMVECQAWISELQRRSALFEENHVLQPRHFESDGEIDAFLSQAQATLLDHRAGKGSSADDITAVDSSVADLFPLPRGDTGPIRKQATQPDLPDWSPFQAEAPQVAVDPLVGTYAKSKYPSRVRAETTSKRGRKPLPKAPPDPASDYSVWATHDGPYLPDDMASLAHAAASIVGMTVEDVLEELKAVEKVLNRTLHPDRHESRRSRGRRSTNRPATTPGSGGDNSPAADALEGSEAD